MPNEYLYGTYGSITDSVVQSSATAETIAVYVGTAPVNLVREYEKTGIIDYPVKVINMADAQRKLGHSPNWQGFTLCEAMSAHFNNPLGNIGPIYLINVLNPEKHRKAAKTTQSLNFMNGQAELRSDTVILDTIALADETEGVTYRAEYNFTKGCVTFTSIDQSNPISGTVEVSYFEVDTAMVTEQSIIGEATENGVYSGIGALNLLHPQMNAVANLMAAPGWSDKPAVYEKMIKACRKINGHWDAFVAVDIPLVAGLDKVDTIDKAVIWQNEHGYTNEFAKSCWPQVLGRDGKVYHISTLTIVEYLRADRLHGSIPMETCGNKQIPVTKQYFGEGSTNRGFDQQTANKITSKGITTAVAWGGKWVLWGDHTAAYRFGAEIDPRCIFDVSMRMLLHVTNGFQQRWGEVVDKPTTRALIDTILNQEQAELDAQAAQGAFIGKPVVSFIQTNNPTENLIEGNFRWDFETTPTPPTKSITACVAYTTAGFNSYYETGGEEG